MDGLDLSVRSDGELFESLFSIVEELSCCDNDYKEVNKDEVIKTAKELERRNKAQYEIFKRMCITLASHASCPAEVGMKLDNNDKETLQCKRNRCIKIKNDDRADMCWNIYFFSQIKKAVKEARI